MNQISEGNANITNFIKNIVQADEEGVEEKFNEDSPNASPILKIKNAIWVLENAIMNNHYPLKQNDPVFKELISQLPYCIDDTGISGVQIIVNRQYIPVGWLGSIAPYHKFSSHHLYLTQEKLDSLRFYYGETIWLGGYNSPFENINNAMRYLQKLRAIIKFIEN